MTSRKAISILGALRAASDALNAAQGELGTRTHDDDPRMREVASMAWVRVEHARRDVDQASELAHRIDKAMRSRGELGTRSEPSKKAVKRARRSPAKRARKAPVRR